jgi:hypothetical protein
VCLVKITHWRFASWPNPVGMSNPQVVVNLLAELRISMNRLRRNPRVVEILDRDACLPHKRYAVLNRKWRLPSCRSAFAPCRSPLNLVRQRLGLTASVFIAFSRARRFGDCRRLVTRNTVVAAPKTKTAAKLLKPMRAVRFIMNTVKMWVLSELWKATFAHKTLVLSTPAV